MYPDPITPRAHPDLLSRVDYDPFAVMPQELPQAPRVFTTVARIERARQRIAGGSIVDQHCFAHLIKSCALEEPLPPLPPADGPPDWGGPLLLWLRPAFHNALAWALTDATRHRERAIEALRRVAAACTRYPWTGSEHQEAELAARAYDLLASTGLQPADDNSFRGMLWTFMDALKNAEHRACNNHNSMSLTAQLAIGAALGHLQIIHDAWYGCEHNGEWRYGLIHTLRHDFLADGMHWEGTMGYHMVVLRNICESLTIMENLGIDLWHREWPSTMQDELFDEHRGWGPKGNKPVTAAFDAFLYQAFANGDYTLLHDEVLGNLRGAGAWCLLFNKAHEVYREPRYAWALRHINRGEVATAQGPVPVWFEASLGDVEFVRLEERDLPPGENPLERDRVLSLTGRHENGCSLFPTHGSAVLRSNALDEQAPGARLYWGQHWAGHRSPAALHLDIHAHGRRLTTAPHLFQAGYDDPRHLTWLRSTIAHNTVTLDGQSMFPYDFPTDSLWECDRWRVTISDATLELFQAQDDFKVVRASNDNVYRDAKLDRTVVLTEHYLLDVFRVVSSEPRLMDWAMHLQGADVSTNGYEPVNLGEGRGYCHLDNAVLHPQQQGWVALTCGIAAKSGAHIWLGGAPGARLIIAGDPAVDKRTPIGDGHPPQPRTSFIVRSQSAQAVFVSLWSFGTAMVEPVAIHGTADSDMTIELRHQENSTNWSLPLSGEVTCRRISD
jgi:hypothetical protein